MIVHGAEDMAVPYNQSERLYAALQRAGVPATLIRVEGAGHGRFNHPEVERRVRLFLDKHLRGQDVEVSGETIRAPVDP